VEVRDPICPENDSMRRMVPMATCDLFASSTCSQPSNARAARSCRPDLAQSIRDWYAVKQPGKPSSAGMERLYVELGVLDGQIADGRVDPAKVQLESVIVYVTKEKFAPAASAAK
jgi:hypothetical protein